MLILAAPSLLFTCLASARLAFVITLFAVDTHRKDFHDDCASDYDLHTCHESIASSNHI